MEFRLWNITHKMEIQKSLFLSLATSSHSLLPLFFFLPIHLSHLLFFISHFILLSLTLFKSFPLALMVNNLPVIQETWVPSPSQENPLEKGIVTYSSILAWIILPTEEAGWLPSMVLQRVGNDWATDTTITTTFNIIYTYHSSLNVIQIKSSSQIALWRMKNRLKYFKSFLFSINSMWLLHCI